MKETREFAEHLQAVGVLGDKERIVRQNEISVCTLLMEMVVGEGPFTVIADGRCDIERAVELAKQKIGA